MLKSHCWSDGGAWTGQWAGGQPLVADYDLFVAVSSSFFFCFWKCACVLDLLFWILDRQQPVPDQKHTKFWEEQAQKAAGSHLGMHQCLNKTNCVTVLCSYLCVI